MEPCGRNHDHERHRAVVSLPGEPEGRGRLLPVSVTITTLSPWSSGVRLRGRGPPPAHDVVRSGCGGTRPTLPTSVALVALGNGSKKVCYSAGSWSSWNVTSAGRTYDAPPPCRDDQGAQRGGRDA